MNVSDTILGSRFFGRRASVYALCTMLAIPAGGLNAAQNQDDVQVSDYGTVDISVQDTDLVMVLQMLAIESKKNIITSKAVTGTVSANLYDVTFYEALDAILKVNGYTYYEEGNFIYVITRDEWEAMEKAKRKTESRIFNLEHLAASDAMEFILPLLSADGKASARGDVQPGMKPTVSDGGADDYAHTPRLVVNDYPENLESIANLLNELDVPPEQVLVEATILQAALDEENAFGVDFTILGSMDFTDIVNPLSAVGNLLNGSDPANGFQPPDNRARAITSNVGNTSGAGGLKVGVLADDVAVFLRVLDEVTDNTVLARPKLMALNRQRAQVLVGARVGYLSTTATETTTTQSVQFLDTGIQLVFRPFISKDGMIRMELAPSVSEASLRSVTDANGLIVTIPDELTNEVTTNVRVKDGQTLVLGGLFKESTRITRRQIPVLGDIPIVGAAFRGQDDSIERSEIIFLITPSIVRDEVLWAQGADVLNNVDAMRVGARAGLLPFSREKVTQRYNQKAQDAFQRGDHERALYYINNSLRLAPQQPEVVKLREKVTGDMARIHERSMMERVFRKELESTPPSVSWHWDEVPAPAPNSSEHDALVFDEAAELTMSSDEDAAIDEVAATLPDEETDEVTETVSVDTDHQPLFLEPQASAAGVANDNAAAQQNTELSPEQRLFYQNCLHEFFMAVGMPHLAAAYAAPTDSSMWEFPFTTFDDVTEVAGVTASPDLSK